MRITIVQGAFLPVPPIMGGAVEKVWHGLGQEFARRGHEVLHVSRRHPHLSTTETAGGVRHLRVSGFAQPRSLPLLKLKDLLFTLAVRRHLPPADIIVSNTFWLPLLVRAPRYGRMVVHVARFPRGQMRHYRHVACLQTVSSAVARAIADELGGGHAPRLCVIPYPVAHRAASLPAPTERTPTILYTGRVHPEKGLDLLLSAWRRAAPHLPGWKLRIVGPWRAEEGGAGAAYFELLKHEARGLPVDFVGPVFGAEALNHEYRSASIFVYPSLAARGETFGLAPLEAMAFGLPAIVSGLECFRDFVHPEQNGLVFDHDDGNAGGELAERIVRLADDHELRATLGAAAWADSASYTEAAVAEAYLAEFAALLRDPAPSRR